MFVKNPTLHLPIGGVIITQGRYKGLLGYYDDDETLDSGDIRAVVYLDKPLAGSYQLIKHEYLVEATEKNIIKYWNQKMMKQAAKRLSNAE